MERSDLLRRAGQRESGRRQSEKNSYQEGTRADNKGSTFKSRPVPAVPAPKVQFVDGKRAANLFIALE